MTIVSDYDCRSYSTYFFYNYQTCFKSVSNNNIDGVENNYYIFYKARPFLTPSRIFWPSDRDLRQITFSSLGYNPGDLVGVVYLDGRWARCEYNSRNDLEKPDLSVCGNFRKYKIVNEGKWNNDYFK